MLYALLIILLVLGITYFAAKLSREKPEFIKKAARVGSLVAGLMFLLRLGPAFILGVLNFLAMLLPFIKQKEAHSRARSDSNNDRMSRKEAREILGVSDKATQKEIKVAFNNLMKKNHPDKNGSKYLAQKIIQAKKTLIGK